QYALPLARGGQPELAIAMVCFRISLLLLVIFVFSFIPSSSHISTCRGCLWTVPDAVLLTRPDGFYLFEGKHGGGYRYLGVFAKGDRSFYVYMQEDVQVDRIRFGWPLRATTLDVVRGRSEWYLVFEIWGFLANLVLLFLVWSVVQPIIAPAANLSYGLLNRIRPAWQNSLRRTDHNE